MMMIRRVRQVNDQKQQAAQSCDAVQDETQLPNASTIFDQVCQCSYAHTASKLFPANDFISSLAGTRVQIALYPYQPSQTDHEPKDSDDLGLCQSKDDNAI